MKTSELTGAALDYAAGLCEGYGPDKYMSNIDIRLDVKGKVSCLLVPINRAYVRWTPSTNWAQGGPIIEREGIALRYSPKHKKWYAKRETGSGETVFWPAQEYSVTAKKKVTARWEGPTPLVAAMRCYIASKLGNDIEIPKEFQA